MATKDSYVKSSEILRATPNWLASEVGIITQTAMSDSASVSADENGNKIIKSGTVIKKGGTVIGLLYGMDVDVTDGDELIPILVAGRVYENRLPETITENKTTLQALGIVFENCPDVTRPY